MAHALPSADLGGFLAATTAVMLLATVARAGTDRSILFLTGRALAAGRVDDARRVVTQALHRAAIGGGIAAVGMLSPIGAWVLGAVLPSPSFHAQAAISVWLAAEVVRLPMVEVLRAWLRVRRAGLLGEALRGALLTVAMVIVVNMVRHPDLADVFTAAAAATLLATLIVGGAFAVSASADPVRLTSMAPLTLGNAPLPASRWWIVSADLATQVIAQADIWVAATILGPAAAARYGVAARLALLPALLLPVMAASYVPVAAQLHAAGDRAALERATRHVAKIAGAGALTILIVYGLAGRFLISSLFGRNFRSAWPILMCLSAGQLVNALAGPCGALLLVTNRQRRAATCVVAVALTALVLEPFGASAGGAVGLATTSGGATAAVNVWLAFAVCRELGIATWPSLVGSRPDGTASG